jgi:hypothetical protein
MPRGRRAPVIQYHSGLHLACEAGFGITLGAYDPSSIMNYCNSQKTVLITLDKQGFWKAYSFL